MIPIIRFFLRFIALNTFAHFLFRFPVYVLKRTEIAQILTLSADLEIGTVGTLYVIFGTPPQFQLTNDSLSANNLSEPPKVYQLNLE